MSTVSNFAQQRPILVGFFAMLVTIVLGMSVAFVTGLTTPERVFATVVGPCCGGGGGGGVPPGTEVPPQVPPVVGCMDQDANNYDPNAMAPANDSCIYTMGCTDPAALNYNSAAKRDDGSCTYPQKPTCSLTADPTSIVKGDSSTLSWTTTNADTFSIDQSVGVVTPVAAGSTSVSPADTMTYTGTATGPGGTVTCTAKVKVTTTPPPPKPTCSLTADPLFVLTGATSTLAWTTTNATTFTMDQGIGSVATTSGSRVVTPPGTTTYTGTAVGPGGTVTCDATVTVTVLPPPEPSCTLSANPTSISKGSTSSLSWATTNAASFSIDQGIGNVATTSGATSTPALYNDTTYTGTVTGNGYTKTCTATITTHGGGAGGPSCSLSASPMIVVSGHKAVLSWTTSSAVSFTLDNSIGSVTPVAVGTTSTPSLGVSTTFTGVAEDASGAKVSCSVTVTVPTGGCTSSCCSGHCGGYTPPTISLTSLPHVNIQPLAYLYLSQIPYTGLDLGPVGTAVYWLVVIALSAVLSYITIFIALPYVNRKAREFAGSVHAVVNEPVQTATVSTAPAAPAVPISKRDAPEPDLPRYHSPYEGFKSFRKEGSSALSVEDIVKGLSRQPYAPKTEPIYDHVEPIDEPAPTRAEAPSRVAPPTTPIVSADARGLALALINGDRAGVFNGLRQHARGGGAPEALVSDIACLLDEAYRARIEGVHANEAVTRASARLDTPTLERLVASLTTAIDSSYTDPMTGAKLALTRALTTLGA